MLRAKLKKMKSKIFLSILILSLSDICFGQKDSIAPKKNIFGINTGILTDNQTGFDYYTHFTLEKGQSLFAIGPIIGQKIKIGGSNGDDFRSDGGNYTLTGFNAVYQISPNPDRKIFHSYFQNELVFHYYIDNNTTNNPNEQVWLTSPISYKSHQTIIGDFIGWGFKVKFLNNFCISQSIGLGIAYYSTIQNYENIIYNRNDHNFNLDFIAKLGLGYKFDYKNYKLKPVLSGPFKKKNPIISYSAFSAEQLDSIISTKQTNSIASPPIILGLNFGIMPSYTGAQLDYYSNFTIERGKDFIALGPIIGQKAEINYYNLHTERGAYALAGFNFVYQRHPNPYGKIFDVYFQNEFIFRHYSDEGINYLQQSNSSYQVTRSYKSNQSDIEDYIGYGCKEKFLKNFYFNQSIGIGVVYHSTMIDYGDINYNTNEHDTHLGLMLKMGIGYKFDYKSKPLAAVFKVQKDSIAPQKISYGINVCSFIPIYQNSGLDYYANFAIEKGRNSLAIGPVIGLKMKLSYDYFDVSNQYGLTGFNVVYQRNTKPYGKRFDFYFQNNFIFQYYTDNGIGQVPGLYSILLKSYKAHETDIANFISYGCKIKFLKNFYIDQSFGMGIIYISSVVNYGDNYYISSNKDTPPGYLLKIGIGYTFEHKLKPATNKK